jgi:hypothetical protein
VAFRPATRAAAGAGPRHMVVDHAHLQDKVDLAVPLRPIQAVRWRPAMPPTNVRPDGVLRVGTPGGGGRAWRMLPAIRPPPPPVNVVLLPYMSSLSALACI